MTKIKHPYLDLNLANTDIVFDPEILPPLSHASLIKALSSFVLSPSGWRAIFATKEESHAQEIGAAHRYIAAYAAWAFVEFLNKKPSFRETEDEKESLHILIATDSRPTGPAIANELIRCLLALGVKVTYSSITAIPELMAWSRNDVSGHADCDGFIYVSASHNPIGYNGLKFGRNNGGVLVGDEAHELIKIFHALIEDDRDFKKLFDILKKADKSDFIRILSDVRNAKRHARSAYILFSRQVLAQSSDFEEQDHLLDLLEKGIQENPLGIAIDFNGSARADSIDCDFLEGLSIELKTIHEKAGKIVHRIVPEGISLEPLSKLLEEAHAENPAFSLGYMSDCDGDRGNLVVWNGTHAEALGAQETFALALIGELAYTEWKAQWNEEEDFYTSPSAIVINDPSSLRCDEIAEAFGAEVFRAEVGEANVVSLAQSLRKEGYSIPILGEGAAGGTITHPAAVRDPLNTLFAILKLLALRSGPYGAGLFELWCRQSGQEDLYREDFTLADILASLPPYATTSAYEARALLQIKSKDHASLKSRFEEIFYRDWEDKALALREKADFASWVAYGYNGISEERLENDFAKSGNGGLRIVFFDTYEEKRGFIWMRASGTEPVFRIMAEYSARDRHREDIYTFNKNIEVEVLDWLRAMVEEADMQEGH